MYMACIIRSEAKAKIFYFIYTKKTNRKRIVKTQFVKTNVHKLQMLKMVYRSQIYIVIIYTLN